jgi:hypothetical protein
MDSEPAQGNNTGRRAAWVDFCRTVIMFPAEGWLASSRTFDPGMLATLCALR